MSFAPFDNLLDYREPETDALVVHLGCSEKLSEAREELGLILLLNTNTSVANVPDQQLLVVVVGQCNANRSLSREL